MVTDLLRVELERLRRDDDMTAARCSCGFTELADERATDHLLKVFEPDDLTGSDGLVHEERDRLACACGWSAGTPDEMDAHFQAVFTPGDAIGRDSYKHELMEARDDA